MIIPGQNQLSLPEALQVPDYEQLLTQLKQTTIREVAKQDKTQADALAVTFENNAEILTKMLQSQVYVLQQHIRHINAQAIQMFAMYATGDNLDLVASQLGLERQVIEPGDSEAFPPKPPVMENDESLRLRYFLAPYAFSTAGPQKAYVYHGLTLGEQPEISVKKRSDTELILHYQFPRNGLSAQVKDATAINPEPGKVTVTLLAYDQAKLENTTAADKREALQTQLDELKTAAVHYFNREDITPTTDHVTVQLAELVPYDIEAVCYIYKGPDAKITQQQAEAALQDYAETQLRLAAIIDIGQIYHALHEVGASRVDLNQPIERLITAPHQAPVCRSINVQVKTM
ncbi:baseplate J/gp47 family protein [Spartinivicinus ruber]|uniref:baseplate J/gp47 family protein n=1 Tax=Spartinivicinus ruber TaxID=2683272 RepID=UPI0013D793AF|nr:baseplate J/gp47 family protein [Spartinivicinus ruber]